MGVPPPEIQKRLRAELDNDVRDVSDLWAEAMNAYKGIMGFELAPQFRSVQDMMDYGSNEMANFHKFRHNEKKVDQLRGLLKANLGFIEKGAQQLISAATPAFPPAAAIGTALTYMLKACRQVSADYDIVVVFFEDMNSFLARITILETRLPRSKAYQNCLMDVFTSFLSMCAFATRYIQQGRFKKWVTNLMKGDDGDLGAARKTMDKNVDRLQSATELAILGNTEELRTMSGELAANQERHTRLLEEQREAMFAIRDETAAMRSDVAKILRALEEQKKGAPKKDGKVQASQGKPPSANRIRNALPDVDGEGVDYRVLSETMLAGGCAWVFAEPAWEAWMALAEGERPLLAITGPSGTGKSHIAATVHNHLTELARDEAEKQTCVAHFYFREERASLTTITSALTVVINQVAEQNSAACESFYGLMTKEDMSFDVEEWRDILGKLLGPVFEADSKDRLFIVLDGLDELGDLERGQLTDLMRRIRRARLRISVIVTSRPDTVPGMPDEIGVTTIAITKEKQLADLKALVQSRIDVLGNLRRFSRYVKQRIADRVEEVAPNMLYAQHLLSRYDTLGREGAVLKELGRPVPPDLHALYTNMLVETQRRTVAGRQEIVRTIFQWLSFSFRPLVLDEVVSLIRFVAGEHELDLEELPEVFWKFLRIGDPGTERDEHDAATLDERNPWRVGVKTLEERAAGGDGDHDRDKEFNDGILPVKLHERSMRSFFRETTRADEVPLRTRASEAHRQIFVTASRIVRRPVPPGVTIDGRLAAYATYFLFDHWALIDPEEHSAEERAEAMQWFGAAMTNKYQFVAMSEWAGADYGDKFTGETLEKISAWAGLRRDPAAKEAIDSGLSDDVKEWWDDAAGDSRKALVGLAKAHNKRLYAALDLRAALRSFYMFRVAIQQSSLHDALIEQAIKNYGPEPVQEWQRGSSRPMPSNLAILGVTGFFPDLEVRAVADRAVAQLLLNFDHAQAAEAKCGAALGALGDADATERFKILELLGRVQLALDRPEEALRTLSDCLAGVGADGVPPALARAAHVTRARVHARLGDKEAAAAAYRDARAADPQSVTPGAVLDEETGLYDAVGSPRRLVDTVRGWAPLERLTWMAHDYERLAMFRTYDFQDAAARAGEGEFLVAAYEEAIRYLDNVNAGAPLRCDLAQAYLGVCSDAAAARRVLDEVLDGTSTGHPYAITDQDPSNTLSRAVDMQADVLLELFRATADRAEKAALLAAAAAIPARPLAQAVPLSSTWLLHYRIVLARMHLKMGPLAEFQAGLAWAIEGCLEALADDVGWNDLMNLALLAEALSLLSKAVPSARLKAELERTARIVLSAQFSRLDPEVQTFERGSSDDDSGNDDDDDDDADSDNDSSSDDSASDASDLGPAPTDEGDLSDPDIVSRWCDGVCNPTKRFAWWGGRTIYQCTTCMDGNGFLCEECHGIRLAANQGQEGAIKGRSFCGKDHEYLQAPVPGWHGVKDGVLHVDGDEPVTFKEFLRRIRDGLCKEAWEDFWKGG